MSSLSLSLSDIGLCTKTSRSAFIFWVQEASILQVDSSFCALIHIFNAIYYHTLSLSVCAPHAPWGSPPPFFFLFPCTVSLIISYLTLSTPIHIHSHTGSLSQWCFTRSRWKSSDLHVGKRKLRLIRYTHSLGTLTLFVCFTVLHLLFRDPSGLQFT